LGDGRGVFISPFDNVSKRRTFGLNGTCRQGRTVEDINKDYNWIVQMLSKLRGARLDD
jgi:hypothetical protein